MESKSGNPLFFNRLFTLLAGVGLIISGIGLGLDLLPGSSPGISIPQLMMIIGGIVLLIIGLIFRRAPIRQRLTQNIAQNLLVSFVMIVVTLVILEIALTLANVKTRYPTDVPEKFLTAVPWWTCDDSGCHYEYEAMQQACDNKEVSGRRCMVNEQGFHDSQPFIASDDRQDKLRVLMLGDSFTFGGTAQIGSSFVETTEAQLPDAIVWNTGIPGAGTNQALASFEAFAPRLEPQVAILGFFMNDFDDNMFPMDSYFMGVDDTLYPLAIRQYMTDHQGNVVKLDSQADLYYRYNQVDPPRNELEHFMGTTRLGSLLLNTIEAISNVLSKTDGVRVTAQVDVTREHLTHVRDYASEHNIALFVLVIPRREDVTEQGVLFQNAIGLFDELNIPYLNPIAELDAAVDYAPEPDIHWSTEGHEKVGAMLAGCLATFAETNTLSECESLTIP